MIDRMLSFVVAVGLAMLVWLYARSREQEVLDNVTVPVEVVLAPRQAEHYNMELSGPSQVTMSFSGPPQRIRELQVMLQRKELHVVKTITVPDDRQGESRFSDAVTVEPGDIHAPQGVTSLVIEDRNRICYTLHRQVERYLPVRFNPLREETSVPIVIEPASVLVRGPREVLDRVKSIPTQPAELPKWPMHGGAGVSAVGRVPLVNELDGRPIRVSQPEVLVRVPGKLYELHDVQVHFLCPADFHFRPQFIDERAGKVSLRLLGPLQDEPPRVRAFIDLSKGRFISGLNNEPLQIQLPKGFQLAQEALRGVAFQLVPADFTAELGTPSTAPVPTVPRNDAQP
jgi:hypothetical protein